MKKQLLALNRGMEAFAHTVTKWSGTSWAFIVAVGIILLWAITGPIFNFSDTWQLVINTGTTIVTFLMVFLIQRSQNHDALSIHTKLNELIVSIAAANNKLIDIEDMSEEEVRKLHAKYERMGMKVHVKKECIEPVLEQKEKEPVSRGRKRRRAG